VSVGGGGITTGGGTGGLSAAGWRFGAPLLRLLALWRWLRCGGTVKFLFSAENKNFNRLRSLAFSGDQADVSTREGQKAATGRLWPVARRGRPGEPAKGDAGVALDLLVVVRAGNWFKAC
jgi:hypothetical protein